MEETGLSHHPKREPNGIAKAGREARKSGGLPERDSASAEPLKKCVTDITEIKAKDGKLYASALFGCFDAAVLGLSMDTDRKASLCRQALDNAIRPYPALRGAAIHPDRGTQCASGTCRKAVSKYGVSQGMDSAGGRRHDNARCESMWARMKDELPYNRYDTESMTIEGLRAILWGCFISHWNNRRICSANDGLPPMIKRQSYYETTGIAA